jgi:hypothetical protein
MEDNLNILAKRKTISIYFLNKMQRQLQLQALLSKLQLA